MFVRGREWHRDGAVFYVSGCPLAELSSLPGTGYTAQLQGNHSAGNLRFHLSPIHSGTYLEQLSGCACHEPQERGEAGFKGVKRGGHRYISVRAVREWGYVWQGHIKPVKCDVIILLHRLQCNILHFSFHFWSNQFCHQQADFFFQGGMTERNIHKAEKTHHNTRLCSQAANGVCFKHCLWWNYHISLLFVRWSLKGISAFNFYKNKALQIAILCVFVFKIL